MQKLYAALSHQILNEADHNHLIYTLLSFKDFFISLARCHIEHYPIIVSLVNKRSAKPYLIAEGVRFNFPYNPNEQKNISALTQLILSGAFTRKHQAILAHIFLFIATLPVEIRDPMLIGISLELASKKAIRVNAQFQGLVKNIEFFKGILRLLVDNKIFLDAEQYRALLSNTENIIYYSDVLIFLMKHSLLNHENVTAILKYQENIEHIEYILQHFENHFPEKITELAVLAIKSAAYAQHVSTIIRRLSSVGLLTLEEVRKIFSKISSTPSLAGAMNYLHYNSHRASIEDPADLIPETERRSDFDFLLEHPEYAVSLATAIVVLDNIDRYTDEEHNLLAKYPQHAIPLAMGIKAFTLYEKKLATDTNSLSSEKARTLFKTNFILLDSYPEHAESVAKAIILLKEENMPAKFYMSYIRGNPAYAEKLISSIIKLKKANINSDDYVQDLVNDCENILSLTDGIISLHKKSSLTPHFPLIKNYAENAIAMATGLNLLQEQSVPTVENISLLEAYPKKAPHAAEWIILLDKINLQDDQKKILRSKTPAKPVLKLCRKLLDINYTISVELLNTQISDPIKAGLLLKVLDRMQTKILSKENIDLLVNPKAHKDTLTFMTYLGFEKEQDKKIDQNTFDEVISLTPEVVKKYLELASSMSSSGSIMNSFASYKKTYEDTQRVPLAPAPPELIPQERSSPT